MSACSRASSKGQKWPCPEILEGWKAISPAYLGPLTRSRPSPDSCAAPRSCCDTIPRWSRTLVSATEYQTRGGIISTCNRVAVCPYFHGPRNYVDKFRLRTNKFRSRPGPLCARQYIIPLHGLSPPPPPPPEIVLPASSSRACSPPPNELIVERFQKRLATARTSLGLILQAASTENRMKSFLCACKRGWIMDFDFSRLTADAPEGL